jgi:hypothetical protein
MAKGNQESSLREHLANGGQFRPGASTRVLLEEWMAPFLRRRKKRGTESREQEKTYADYLKVPSWPIPWLMHLGDAWEQPRAFNAARGPSHLSYRDRGAGTGATAACEQPRGHECQKDSFDHDNHLFQFNWAMFTHRL